MDFLSVIIDTLLQILRAMPGALSQGLVWGVAAIGIYITFKVLDVADLTVDGSIVTGAAVFTVLFTNGINIWIAMVASFVAGAISGLVTGYLHTLLGIPVILTGILTQLMLWSANLLILGCAYLPIGGSYKDLKLICTPPKVIEEPATLAILLLFCAVIIALLYWFFGTELGMSLRSTGNNLEMSRAQGINTDFAKVLGLALSNGIVALAGSLLAQQKGAADINMGKGAIVIGLAAVIIGEAFCGKATANFAVRLIFVVVGAIVYWIVYQIVILFGLPSDLLKMLSAIVVTLFLGIPYLKKKHFGKKKKKGGAVNA